jgi:hypothetical protein
MPAHAWTTYYMDAAKKLEQRRSIGSRTPGLLAWAGFSVDALYYLADVDDFVVTQSPQRWLRHQPETIDLANAYLAASLAFAGLDRCAAVLGRIYGSATARTELSIPSFQPWSRKKSVQKRRNRLPKPARLWVRGVWLDHEYQTIRAVRHPLTHASTRRHIKRPIRASHSDRMGLQRHLPRASQVTNVRDLILVSRDVATRHVEYFNLLIVTDEI